MKKTFFYAILFLLIFFECNAQTATLYPIADNTIFEENAAVSNGIGGQIFAGRTSGTSGALSRRSLIKFNLTSIPSNANITSVTLKMACSQVPSGAIDNIIGLQKCNAAWGEGTSIGGGQGTAASIGDATWACSFSNGGASCSSAWTTAGGDFSNTISSSVLVSGLGNYIFPSSASLIADVQSWVNNTASNFGWIIKGNELIQRNAKAFLSREGNATATELTISYTVNSCAGGNTWNGTIDNKWETPGNWSCGIVPNANTDVIIPAGSIVGVNSAAECRNLQINSSAQVTINNGFTIKIFN